MTAHGQKGRAHMMVVELERADGPLHDGEGIIDSVYDNGAWDTLTATEQGMTLIGYSPDRMEFMGANGVKRLVQAGMFLTVRGQGLAYVMTNGGGA